MATNFPHGVASMGAVLGPVGIPVGGTHYYVKPYSGLDGNDGLSLDTAVQTLTKAQALATANKNDVVHLIAESNTAGSTTDYQAAPLIWAKDAVHLVGENCGPLMSHRSRVGILSTATTSAMYGMVLVSANGCLFQNVEFFAGIASAYPLYAVKITGMRNHFVNCHIAGIGHDTMDATGAASLVLYDSHENVFDGCVIGIETIGRGTAVVSEILLDGVTACRRNVFRGCLIVGFCQSAGNYTFVTASAKCCEGFLVFADCMMLNTGTAKSGGAAMTQAMIIPATANGNVILHNTTIVGAGNVNSADVGLILCGAGSVPNNATKTDLGLALVTTNA
jgi:hypothetical protein